MTELLAPCSLFLKGRSRLGRSDWDEAALEDCLLWGEQSWDVVENNGLTPGEGLKTKLNFGENSAREAPDLNGSGAPLSLLERI